MKDKNSFGNFLREAIKQTAISQSEFYLSVGITKPYFYDILSGKVNPPPPDVQYKMLDRLKIGKEAKIEFLNLAAKGRGEIPADIARIIEEHPEKLDEFRAVLINMIAKEEMNKKTAKENDNDE